MYMRYLDIIAEFISFNGEFLHLAQLHTEWLNT